MRRRTVVEVASGQPTAQGVGARTHAAAEGTIHEAFDQAPPSIGLVTVVGFLAAFLGNEHG